MPQPPLQIDAISIQPDSVLDDLIISRDPASGGLLFNDGTLASPVTLAQLIASSIDNVLVVSTTGPATYSSIQDALDAVPAVPATPYTILVHAGTYEENIAWSKPDVTLVGVGNVNITAATGNTITITGEIEARINNVTVSNTGAGTCLIATGIEAARVVSLTVEQCTFAPGALAASATLTFVKNVLFRDCIFGATGSFLSTQSGQFRAYNTVFPSLGISYDPTLDITFPVNGYHYLQDCRVILNTTMTLTTPAQFEGYGLVTGPVVLGGTGSFTLRNGSSTTLSTTATLTASNHTFTSVSGAGPVDRDRFRGSVSFAASDEETHTFAVPMTDNAYMVVIEPIGKTATVSAKTNTEFTLTLDSATTGTVYFEVIR